MIYTFAFAADDSLFVSRQYVSLKDLVYAMVNQKDLGTIVISGSNPCSQKPSPIGKFYMQGGRQLNGQTSKKFNSVGMYSVFCDGAPLDKATQDGFYNLWAEAEQEKAERQGAEAALETIADHIKTYKHRSEWIRRFFNVIMEEMPDQSFTYIPVVKS